MKTKEQEYYRLREQWQVHLKTGQLSEEIRYVTTMVKKDVLRTDRTNKFYSGADDNKNLLSLFNLLVTYALTHPEISYCQGMSDIASPLLVTQKDEAQAYLCFCGMMKRLRGNFHYDGNAITDKFKHLSDLLKLHDPVLFTYLQDINAHDLFFCYRWLLLELKREFPFEDALYMLEVMWSTLPPDPPECSLKLTDEEYTPDILSTSPLSPSFTMKQTIYAKLIAMRRTRTGTKAVPRDIRKDSDECKEKEIAGGSANNNSRIIVNGDTTEDQNARTCITDSVEYPALETEETRNSIARSCSMDKTLEMNLKKQEYGSMKSINENTKDLEMENGKQCSEEDPMESLKDSKETEKSQTESDLCHGEEIEDETVPNGFTDAAENICQDKNSASDKENQIKKDEQKETKVVESETVETSLQEISSERKTKQSDASLEEFSIERSSEFVSCASDDPEDIYIDDDSGQSQFYISLDSSEEVKEQPKPEKEFTGFFKNVKKLLSSPKHQANIVTKSESGDHNVSVPNSTGQMGGEKLEQKADAVVNGVKEINVTQNDSGHLSDCVELSDADSSMEVVKRNASEVTLPAPEDFGAGNPFLMFLCLTLLLQHRDLILQNKLEYDEIAIMFDRLVRKHNVNKVLHQARNIYSDYLRTQQKLAEQQEEADPSV